MIVNDRFELRELLAHGQAKTWNAWDREEDREVIIKELSLERVDAWKGLDLFEREAQVLAQLKHTAIPEFVAFIRPTKDNKNHYLIQAKVQGQTLLDWIAQGTLDGDDLRWLTRSTLGVLAYLHGFSPPVIHRDVKPANIIVDPESKLLWLVDFGAVQLVTPSDEGGSTIVGTSGYMAPEQLLGRASAVSDLYGLGTTLVHALTGTDPSDLPMYRMKLLWRDVVKIEVDEKFLDLVGRLIEPVPEDRCESAAVALAVVTPFARSTENESLESLERRQLPTVAKPTTTGVTLRTKGDVLTVEIAGRGGQSPGILIGGAIGALVILMFSFGNSQAGAVMGVVAALLVFLASVWLTLDLGQNPNRLTIDRKGRFEIQGALPELGDITNGGQANDIIAVTEGHGKDEDVLYLTTAANAFPFARRLTRGEQRYLQSEIEKFVHGR